MAHPTAVWCAECGYSLRGLPNDRPCPECGMSPTAEASPQLPRHAAWSRAVFCGLVLFLIITVHAVCSVLIQPFSERWGGVAPALNMPGPKLWAMPLMQRPIGSSPELPGVVGTRTAILSLLAVWLITWPPNNPRMQRGESLRLATRWGSVILFGVAFGTMMAREGIWSSELAPFRVLLVGAVELPATTLLYLYLRRLAAQAMGRDRRRTFDQLAVLVPMTILAGAAALAVQWWIDEPRARSAPPNLVPAGTILYATFATVCGIAATAAVGDLAGVFFHWGFPFAHRLLTAARHVVRRIGASPAPRLPAPDRVRPMLIAGGLVLLVIVMIFGNDEVFWMLPRLGVGGHLPFVNFPGPKLWAAVGVSGSGPRYGWDPIVSRTTLIMLNLTAVWLVTIPLDARDANSLFRRVVRWLPVLSIGAAMACTMTIQTGDLDVARAATRSRVFAALTMCFELPATVLLYERLARVARDCGRARVARQLRGVAITVVVLVCVSVLAMAMSRDFFAHRASAIVMTLAAGQGAVAIASAAWATALMFTLAGAMVARAIERREAVEVGTLARAA